MSDASRRGMNRRQRRILRAEADRLAARLATTCFDYTPEGNLVRVADCRAVRVLEVAFAAMLRNGGEPLAIEITADAASAFPRRSSIMGEGRGAKPWLAVGIDQDGRGTYSLRHLNVAGVTRSEAAALAELAMLAELQRETAKAGFPMGAPVGGVC